MSDARSEGFLVIGRTEGLKWEGGRTYTEEEALILADALNAANEREGVTYTAHAIGPAIERTEAPS